MCEGRIQILFEQKLLVIKIMAVIANNSSIFYHIDSLYEFLYCSNDLSIYLFEVKIIVHSLE